MRQPDRRPFASVVGSRNVVGSWNVAGRSCVAALALLITLGSVPALTQILYGSITGNVSDQTGAALPGITVEVVNTGTGVIKTVTTDDRGNYALIDLQPGVYDVSIKQTGFQPITRKNAQVASRLPRWPRLTQHRP